MSLEILIPGKPFALKRARHARTKVGFTVTHDHPDNVSWKGAAQHHMLIAVGDRRPYIPEGPVAVWVEARFECPKSEHRKGEPRPARWHDRHRGDVDNIVKAVLDAGNGILWMDDRQVAQLTVQKVIAAQGAPPETWVLVESLEETDVRLHQPQEASNGQDREHQAPQALLPLSGAPREGAAEAERGERDPAPQAQGCR